MLGCTLPSMVVYTSIHNGQSAACSTTSATSATVSAASATVAAAVTASPGSPASGSAPGPASGSTTGAASPLGDFGGRLFEPLQLRQRGGRGVPERYRIQGCRSLTLHSHECAHLRAGHQGHAGLHGGLGPVVNGSAAPVHAQELHRRVPEERRELLQPLVYPRGDLSAVVLVSGKAAIPCLETKKREKKNFSQITLF